MWFAAFVVVALHFARSLQPTVQPALIHPHHVITHTPKKDESRNQGEQQQT